MNTQTKGIGQRSERFTMNERGANVAACTIAFLSARACDGRDTRPIREDRAIAPVVIGWLATCSVVSAKDRDSI
jgi:hypothetical protein